MGIRPIYFYSGITDQWNNILPKCPIFLVALYPQPWTELGERYHPRAMINIICGNTPVMQQQYVDDVGRKTLEINLRNPWFLLPLPPPPPHEFPVCIENVI